MYNGTRSAPQAAHGNPGQASNAGIRAILSQAAAAQQAAAAHYNASPVTSGLLNQMGAQGLGVGQLMQQSAFAAAYKAALEGRALEAQKPLESAGTTFGEFIGWRIWGLAQGYLTSFSADYAWLPGHPAEGDVSDRGSGGIWAFKDPHRAFKKALESPTGAPMVVEGWVTGSVWMYGELVEHAIGYRSQYATVRSVEAIIPNERCAASHGWKKWAEKREVRRQSEAMLDELRERYGVKAEAIDA